MGGRGANSSLSGGGAKKLKLGESGAKNNPSSPIGGAPALNSKESLAKWNDAGIAQWFVDRNMSDMEAYAYGEGSGGLVAVKETEKAVQLQGDFGKKWFPKSVLVAGGNTTPFSMPSTYRARRAQAAAAAKERKQQRLAAARERTNRIRQTTGITGITANMTPLTIANIAAKQGKLDKLSQFMNFRMTDVNTTSSLDITAKRKGWAVSYATFIGD